MNKYLLWGCISLSSVSNAYAELPQEFGKLELKLNTRYWNDEALPTPRLPTLHLRRVNMNKVL